MYLAAKEVLAGAWLVSLNSNSVVVMIELILYVSWQAT